MKRLERLIAKLRGDLWTVPPSFSMKSTGFPCLLSRKNRIGFTLVEVLVTLAIVAILASLAFPLYQAMTASSRTVRCVNNLRTIGAAVNTYLADNNLLYPVSSYPVLTTKVNWWTEIAPYMNCELANAGPPYPRAVALGHCPNHTEKADSFSYVGNMFIFVPDNLAYTSKYMPGFDHRVSAAAVRKPTEKMLVWEVHSNAAWPRISVPDSGTGKRPLIPAYKYGAHGDKTNFLFCDGHVASISAADGLANYANWKYWDPYR
ncbi:MAG: prepilin-type N-terminal cleavage/methylation domain-containing protein [Phycisphaerae bacterium]